ncbi:MAG: hypothetical protein ABH861_02235 [Patescibacteria group bacterium]|nr:hypothetical protein [Patescibacteria group bacterium]
MVGGMSDYQTRTMLEAAAREHGEREKKLVHVYDPFEMPEPQAGWQDVFDIPPPSDAEPLSAKVFELAGIRDPNSLASRVFGDSNDVPSG